MPESVDSNLPAKDVIRHLTHELRQPLSALESIAYYLQLTVASGGGADVSAHVHRLQQMVDNANWVLSDVLHLLQMAPPNPSVVDIEELLAEVVNESWAAEGLTVHTEVPEEFPDAWVDAEQLRHLLRSVLQFLRRTMEEPREVILIGSIQPGAIHVEFRATAPTVVPDLVFNPLEGNQLLTCRRIAENNAGRFHVFQDPGGWLSLRLQLPVPPLT